MVRSLADGVVSAFEQGDQQAVHVALQAIWRLVEAKEMRVVGEPLAEELGTRQLAAGDVQGVPEGDVVELHAARGKRR